MRSNRIVLVSLVAACGAVGLVSSSRLFANQPPSVLSAAEVAAKVDEGLARELFDPAGLGQNDLAPLADDATFLRRINLDLVGNLPTPAEITAFLLDPAPDKRARTIDTLLTKDRFGQNWGRFWRDVIFYRRSDERALLAAPAAEKFLTEAFNAGTPWNEIAAAFITATGSISDDGRTAPIAAQMASTEDVTAEVSRIFLGIQIQCAQCHDHPTDRWKRRQFHELAAFFPRIEVRPVRMGFPRDFEVVGVDRRPYFARPGGNFRRAELEHNLPDLMNPQATGDVLVPTLFLTGQSVPLGTSDSDRRSTLASWLTSTDNPWFAKAFVNRIWSEFVGEGFYNPVDDMGPERECSAPQTLDLLAEQFAGHNFDVKWLFSAITRTAAYGRQSRAARQSDGIPFTANAAYRLRSDQVLDILFTAIGGDESDTPLPRAMMGGQRPGRGGLRGQFAETFGYDPSDSRSEVTGSIPQTLLLMNAPNVQRWVNARNQRTVLGNALGETSDDDQVILELFLRCLARQPTRAEMAECRKYVAGVDDRGEAFEDIMWSLVNRAEFLYRH